MRIIDSAIAPFVIEVDGTQYTVGEPKVDKKGNEFLSTPKYFTSLGYCLSYIAKQKIVTSNVNEIVTIKEYIDLYKKAVDLLLEKVKI